MKQREIKYRAWDIENKKMFEVSQIEFFEDGTVIIDGDLPLEFQGNNLRILMQYTGLLDKNGKEIFEGDILKCIGIEEHENLNGNHKVHFRTDGGFVVCTTLSITWGGFKSIEIIGNKFENKDLIK